MNIFDAFSIFENMGLAINGSARTLRVAFWSSRGLMPLLWLLLVTSCQEDPAPGPGQDDPDDPVFAVETGNSAIPYVVIETHGTGILNEPKIHAEMVIYQQKAEIQRAQIGIEYRGSTSFRISDKKSFGIETWDQQGNDVDVVFFGFPEEEDFILSGQILDTTDHWGFDRTMMYNYLGYELFREMGSYASRTQYVELEINGEYLGVYVFMEKLKRDRNRIDIATLDPGENTPELISGGYVLKIDKTSGGDLKLNQPLEYFENNWDDDARYTEDISFRSDYDIHGEIIDFDAFGPPYHPNMYLETYFLYEYPKATQISESQKTYIQTYIHNFESALLNDDFSSGERTYTSYIDLESFVDFFIINELTRNVDGYRLSTYLYKDRGEKLKMGPIWDLDIGYFSGDRIPMDDWVINYNSYVDRDAWMLPFWWKRLMEDPVFRNALKTRWGELRLGVLSTAQLLQQVDDAASYLQSNGAAARNYRKWDQGSGFSYQAQIESLKSYLQTRSQWMDGMIAAL
jgi:hypothetical protein